MAGFRQVTVSPEAAHLLAAPIEAARERQGRVYELEYSLVKTRGALLLAARIIEGMAEDFAIPSEAQLTDDDVTLLFATVDLLEQAAAGCADAYRG